MAGALIVSFSLSGALAQQQDAPAAAPAAEPARQLCKTSPLPRLLDPHRRRRQHRRCSPARPNSARASRRRFSRSPPKSLMLPFASLKVVTADTRLTANEGYTSGSNSMQGQRHRDPERGGAGARTSGGGSRQRRLGLPAENFTHRKWRGDRRPTADACRYGELVCGRHAARAGAAEDRS